MKKYISLFFLICTIGTAHAEYTSCSNCAKSEWFNGDGACVLDLQEQCGADYSTCVFDEEDGTVYCTGAPGVGPITCTCPETYLGTCSGSDYSTCYKSCLATCDDATCANLREGQLCDRNKTCGGRMYYGSSICQPIGTCSCVVDSGDCTEYTCPSGYTTADGTGKYVDCKNGAPNHEEYCFKTCTSSASHGTVSTTPDNKAYYPDSCSYKCASGYYGTATSSTSGCTKCPSNATCAGGNNSIFKCNKNYFQSGASCMACPSATDRDGNTLNGQTAADGATSFRMCYIASGSKFSDETGDWEYTSNCNHN